MVNTSDFLYRLSKEFMICLFIEILIYALQLNNVFISVFKLRQLKYVTDLLGELAV